jgi:hypothetical protein
VTFIGGLRRFMAGGEDKLESTAADCALVFLHSGLSDLIQCGAREKARR